MVSGRRRQSKGELLSYIALEARVRRDRPAASGLHDCERGTVAVGARVCRALFAHRPAVDPAEEAAARDAVVGLLFDPLGAASDGAAGLRRAVPLVRRDLRRRGRLEPFGILEGGRERLLEGDTAAKFLAAVLAQPKVKRLLSSDDFSLDCVFQPIVITDSRPS